MKKNRILLFAVAMAFMFACSSGDSPKAVAENFLTAWSKADFEDAKKFGTDDSKKLLDMMNSFKTMVDDSTLKHETPFEIIREKIEGDKAIIFYKEEGNPVESQLPLVKVNGKWKVNVTKESINGTEGNAAIDIGATNTDSMSGNSTVTE